MTGSKGKRTVRGAVFREAPGLILLGLAVLALFLPALTGTLGIFHDDQAMAEFPWHFFLARNFQEGILPLWEPDTWCGAIPFYARYYADTYYFPLWPLYLLTDLGNPDNAYWTLTLLPLLIHYFLAAAGMYLFGRRGIRLSRTAALTAAWVYVFSPAFSYSYVWFPIVAVQAWLPWLLWSVTAMDRGRGWAAAAAGGTASALMILAAQPPHAGYGLLLAFLLALALGLRRVGSGDPIACLRAPGRFLAAAALGLALSAVFWVSALDGSRHTEQHLPSTYAAMTGADGSMPPVYLAVLFIPDLFGTLTGFGDHNWVESVTQGVRFWDANMAAGLLLTFLAAAGLAWIRKSRAGARFRGWALFAAAVWVFSILCMLGRHTPFYALFYRWVPVLSGFPFPIRYRLLQVAATSWLAGLGMEWLAGRGRTFRPRAGLVWGFLGLAGLAGLAALAGQTGLAGAADGRVYFPGWREIVRRADGEWFLSGPVLYFFAAAFFLVVAWRGFRGRTRVFLVAALVMAETGLQSFAVFYFCIFRFHQPQPQQIRSIRPSRQPMLGLILGPVAEYTGTSSLRWTSDRPFHDNFARLMPKEGWAFLGYDMKPLEKRFKLAFETAYGRPVDWPIYWDSLRPKFSAFLSNMSVEWFLDSGPGNLFPGGSTFPLETQPDFYLHYNPEAIPRAFVLDRAAEVDEAEALERLAQGDLRQAVFLTDTTGDMTTARDLGITDATGNPDRGEEGRRDFAAFQAANPVASLDLSDPNRVRAEVELTRPAVLVFTETWYPGWEATVDGKPADVLRVNFLQRGLLLPRGRHRVEMNFRPKAWRLGAAISLISWLALGALTAVSLIRRRRARARRLPGRDRGYGQSPESEKSGRIIRDAST
ncbi:MAG TPA: YfhO family protein [bacterium]|nr:YfhO family protein [bacterium]HPQ65172.1 YfhO family protein [bacterium]